MMQLTAGQPVNQGLHHMLLPDQVGEGPRAPFAGEYLVGHRGSGTRAVAGGWNDGTGDDDSATGAIRTRTVGRERGGGPDQPHPGTRGGRCGCSLPGLTGFTA